MKFSLRLLITLFTGLAPCFFAVAVVPSGIQQKRNAGSEIRVEYPVKISKNQRYFTDATGKPFFYQACTGWELLTKLNREETEVYFKNRSEMGFNTIQVFLLPWVVDDGNRYGELPFHEKKFFTHPRECAQLKSHFVVTSAVNNNITCC